MKPILLLFVFLAGPIFRTEGQNQVIVPHVTGYTIDQAKGILSNSHLKEGTVAQELSGSPAGEVILQDPQPGKIVPSGSAVNLTISVVQDTVPVSVPNVTGLKPEEATQVMQEAGLRVDQIYYKISTAKEGKVYKQRPVAGEKVKSGTPVFLVVSRHKHLAAWIIWTIVLAAILLNERLFKWKTKREIEEMELHHSHHGGKEPDQEEKKN